MMWIFLFFSIVGINFSFWLLIGLMRYIYEKLPHKVRLRKGVSVTPIIEKEVAAIIPAHNEALTIKHTISALRKFLPAKNIYVANDNSTDKTGMIARSTGVRVYDIVPNGGKAKAITKVLNQFGILKKYKAVLINDADVEADRRYLKRALPLLHQADVACVAGYQEPRSKKTNWLEKFFILYRVRLWLTIQYGVRFGQTFKYTNVNYIVPGSLSIYKTKVLKKIDIDAPDLIIEDFNMTFELHKKHLGKIAYTPSVRGYHQDPYTFSDYVKQVKRWNLGFWQTVKRNGFWPSLFWLSTGEFIVELILYALFIISTPVLLLVLFYNLFNPAFTLFTLNPSEAITGLSFLFLIDYLLTYIVALVVDKPIMLLYGIGFFFMRYVDAFLFLYTLPLAWISRTSGAWISPKRKQTVLT